ncbi:DUF4221 family protein [Xanthocytophaga agilis]|uniref:DUF4221 family protein n=1 Tax=Xanthocytophaga agilis TaxID=3048010 RepID=A0AAE3UJV1_9BACT|nr:DUF4221 family protein [Xanthocytophaga agilis]MDJ1505773.1 DUF4221 family protein [Xanthocytophaga agilis]
MNRLLKSFIFTLSGVCLLSAVIYWYGVKAEPILVLAPAVNVTDSVTLTIAQSRIWKLDSLTVPEAIDYYQVFHSHISGKKYLTFLNRENRMIYYYDLAGGNLIKVLSLEQFGFKKGDRIQGYSILNEDSVFVYDYKSSTLSLISILKGKLMSRDMVDKVNLGQQSVWPSPFTNRPILWDKTKSELYLAGNFSNEGGMFGSDKVRNNIVRFNYQSGTVDRLVHYPTFYWGGNWGGGGGLRQIFYDQNSEKSLLIISFMADPFLTAYNTQNGQIEKHYAASRYIPHIKSMDYSPIYYEFLDKLTKIEYYFKTPCYTSVIFDPYRHVYYRFAELAAKQFDRSQPLYSHKQKSIIILNRHFDKIGEILLPQSNYDANNFFVDRDGLYLLKKLETDNHLVFQRFELRALKQPKTISKTQI